MDNSLDVTVRFTNLEAQVVRNLAARELEMRRKLGHPDNSTASELLIDVARKIHHEMGG